MDPVEAALASGRKTAQAILRRETIGVTTTRRYDFREGTRGNDHQRLSMRHCTAQSLRDKSYDPAFRHFLHSTRNVHGLVLSSYGVHWRMSVEPRKIAEAARCLSPALVAGN